VVLKSASHGFAQSCVNTKMASSSSNAGGGEAGNPQRDRGSSIHVKVKRRNQTVFILTYPDELVSVLRLKVAEAASQPPTRVHLFRGNDVLRDDRSVRSSCISNGDILQFVIGDEATSEPRQADELINPPILHTSKDAVPSSTGGGQDANGGTAEDAV